MQYRTFKKLDREVSLLGMGAMRLPETEDGQINEPEAIDIIRSAIDAGINYVDTAFGYHNGKSEGLVGKALRDGYREKVLLADKMPIWLAKDEEHMKEMFQTQLERLDTDYIDMYLVHSVNKPNWKRIKKLNLMPFLEEMKAAGKIKHIGFSFHDSYELFEEVLDSYPWEFCQIQLNYLDWNFQNAKAKVELMNERNIPIWVMEGLRGGMLASLSEENTAKLKEMRPDESMVGWAFRFLQSVPGVTVSLSGMSNLDQLKDNIRIFSEDKALSESEMKFITEMADEMVRKGVLPCTACRYCTSRCPKHLDIPRLLELYNEHSFTGGGFIAPMAVDALDPDRRPNACIGCRSCEAVCPQQIKISEAMADFSKMLGLA